MIRLSKQALFRAVNAFKKTPFGCLLRLFLGRMFHGGGEPGAENLDLGIGVILILLAMPGILVSLLMFEKYGSLIRFLRGDGVFDPFVATIPDEYFFIVLSTVVTGAAALWRWDAIFLDRRDHTNLVSLPISLRAIFAANFSAILVLVALFTLVTNAASLVLFPVAVVGSQSSFSVFLRFAAGHAAAVFLASAFSFFAVFALAGVLMALTPASLFRRISLVVRFAVAIGLLTLLASSFHVTAFLDEPSMAAKQRVAMLAPVWFLGISQTVWGNGRTPFYAEMTTIAFVASGSALVIAIVAYLLSFRTSFMRIPESADAGPLSRAQLKLFPLAVAQRLFVRQPTQSACYNFILRTLLRSDAHLQTVLAFTALGLVAAAATTIVGTSSRSLFVGRNPSAEFLSIPFILGYCILIGLRFAFEIPADLRANWTFKLWLNFGDRHARPIARRVLLSCTLPWIIPANFAVTEIYFGLIRAILHTAILTASSIVFVELLLIKFRKIPFTCSYPVFESHSGVILVAYLFGFFLFTDYLPQLEHWSLANPFRAICFVPIFALSLACLYAYRSQMLEMDKELIFEETSPSSF
jgi:hypothetical protein